MTNLHVGYRVLVIRHRLLLHVLSTKCIPYVQYIGQVAVNVLQYMDSRF